MDVEKSSQFLKKYAARLVSAIALAFTLLAPSFGIMLSLAALTISIVFYATKINREKRDIVFASICLFLAIVLQILLEIQMLQQAYVA